MNDTSEPTQPEPAHAVIDCEGAEIAIAARQLRTLVGAEAEQLEIHLATCDRCRAGVADDTRWLVRMSSADFGAGPQLPIVDPSVFTVERELATGGMGRVSLATDRRLGRQVALKEILDPKLRVRFEREALITAHLQHPAIVPVYEAGTWPDGSAFYAMRLVAGTTLHEAIHEAKTLGERLALLHHVTAMVEAIAYAHGRRVIHRDLKTTNVLVGDLGDTVVIDWGLAKSLDEAELSGTTIPRSGGDLTRVGAVMGTPGFMAPEQARGEATDERADVFALGAILYTLLAGEPPYLSDGVETAIARVSAGPPRPIAELSPEAPKDLHAICERAMAHRLEERYPTARELATELRRFEAGQLLARPYSIRELVGRWFRRHRALVLGGLVSLIAVVVIGTLAIVNITQSRAAEREARRQAEVALVQAREAGAVALAGEAMALEEQARVALARGDRDVALVLLHQAMSRGRDTPALRYLIAIALRDRDLLDRDNVTTVPNAIEAHDGEVALDREGGVFRGITKLFDTTSNIVEAAFHDDFLVIQDEDRSLACWNVKTHTLAWRHLAQTTNDRSGKIRFLSSEDRVVFAAADARTLIVRDLATGVLVKQLSFPDEITEVATTGSSAWSMLVISTRDDLVSVFGEHLALIRQIRTPASELAILDQKHVVTTSLDTATIWDVEGSGSVRLVHDQTVGDVAVDRDNGLIVTEAADNTLRVWAASGVLLGLATASDTSLLGPPTISRDNDLLANIGDQLELWRLPTLDARLTLPDRFHGLRSDKLGYSAVVDRKHIRRITAPRFGVLAKVGGRGSAFIGDLLLATAEAPKLDRVASTYDSRGRLMRRKPYSIPIGVWYSSRRRLIVDARDDRGLQLFDVETGDRVTTLGFAGHVALSPSGSRIALADQTRLRMRNEDGDLLHELSIEAIAIAFADERTLVVAHSNGVSRVDTETHEVSLLSNKLARSIEVARNGRVVLLGQDLSVLDTNGALMATTPTYSKAVRCSGDARWIASQNASGAIDVLDLDHELSLTSTIPATNGAVFTIARDGSRVFIGDADGSIRVFEATSGRELETQRLSRRAVKSIVLSPDETTLLVDSFDLSNWSWRHREKTAVLLEISLDTHSLSELTKLVEETGWTFRDGIARAPQSK